MRKVRNLESTPEVRREFAEPYIQPLTEFFQDEHGKPLPDVMVFTILEQSGILERIREFRVVHKMSNDPDSLTAGEQFEEQKRDLYKRGMQGDMQAKKLWFELQSQLDQTLDFNVQVQIKPFRVTDDSLKSIAAQSHYSIVREMLAGIGLRMEVDEAPHVLRQQLVIFMEGFEEWARATYRAKDA